MSTGKIFWNFHFSKLKCIMQFKAQWFYLYLKDPIRCLFIFCANLYSRRRGGIWISLVSVAFCLRGYNARFQRRGGGQVPSVCVCCVLLRVVVGAGVKYQGKRSNDTNCEVHPKSPPMFNSWVSSFGKFSILYFPPNSSPSHWTDTWHHCPF